ncbi:MAG: Spy/CpxP family protein refolding chaperone [Xanthobacteraceae bacterium]
MRGLQAQQRQQRLGLAPQMSDRPSQGANRIAPETARQGRFAARFQDRAGPQRVHAERIAPRLAWRHGRFAAFVPWAGPVFWPYVNNDLFYYAFWPQAYDEGYWAYAYDDLVDAIFWGYGGPYADYAYAAPDVGLKGRAAPRRSGSRRTPPDIVALCEPAKGLSDWPLDEIASVVQATSEQRVLLDELRAAAAQAAAAFKAACPSQISLTPTGRLQAMIARLEATRQAIGIVRPPLDRFYNSLSDEQKARFNAIGPNIGADRPRMAQQSSDQKGCGEPKPGLANLPIERIDELVRPTERQQSALDRLAQATNKAVAILQEACPDFIPQTPVGRLEVMEKRIDAMLQAAKTVQPALQDFYASLSNEQKARFNTLARQASRG